MRRALFVSLSVLAVGCVTSQTYRLDQNVRPVRAPSSVAVLEEAPEGPYTVVARVESHTDTVFKGFKDLRAEIVDRAAQLGADAVIVGPEVKETEFLILTTGIIPCETKKLAGEVIVFR
jgi:hypothetical protein